jgi:hypothetical protein
MDISTADQHKASILSRMSEKVISSFALKTNLPAILIDNGLASATSQGNQAQKFLLGFSLICLSLTIKSSTMIALNLDH